MTWRTIYDAIDESYFEEVTLFTKGFLEHCLKNPNALQNIPYKIKNNIKTIALEEIFYFRVVIIRHKTTVKRGKK